jgi:hypothetical protein
MRSNHVFQRVKFVGGAALFALGLSLAGGAALGACGAADATTGKRVALSTRIVADDGIDAPFTNAFGWSVQLDQVALSVGPLYYFDGAPIFSASVTPRAADPRTALIRLLGIGVAWAHPGHYQPGNAMGQVLSPSSVDLALGPADLPPGDGVSGIFRSGRFTFEPKPVGSAAEALSGHVVVVTGEATKGAVKRKFSAWASESDVLGANGEPVLEGCAFEGEPDVQEDGTVTLHVKPSVWLDQAELDEVPESADGAYVPLPADGEAFRAFTRGLKKGSGIVFTFAPQ